MKSKALVNHLTLSTILLLNKLEVGNFDAYLAPLGGVYYYFLNKYAVQFWLRKIWGQIIQEIIGFLQPTFEGTGTLFKA